MIAYLHQMRVADIWPEHAGHHIVVIYRGHIEYRIAALTTDGEEFYDEHIVDEPCDPVTDIDSHFYACSTCDRNLPLPDLTQRKEH